MAMTKVERAEMDRLADELHLARALRWPAERPVRVDVRSAVALAPLGAVVVAWWSNAHTDQVGEGCFDSTLHSRHRIDKTDAQGTGGPWFPTRRDALLYLRQAATEACAARLAGIDAQIETEPTP